MKRFVLMIAASVLALCALVSCNNGTAESVDGNLKPQRMTQSIRYSENGEYQVYEYKYEYDSEGRLICETMPTGKREYTYDKNGRLTESKFSPATPSVASTPATVSVTKYVYDDNGRLTEEIVEGSGSKNYYYDGDKCTKEEYYVKGNNSPITTVKYTYDKDGKLASSVTESYGDVDTTVYTYSEGGRLVSEQRTHVSVYGGKTVASSSYTYDKGGNIVKIHYVTESSEGASTLLSFERITEYFDFIDPTKNNKSY